MNKNTLSTRWNTRCVPWHSLLRVLKVKPGRHSHRYAPSRLTQAWLPHFLPIRHSSTSMSRQEKEMKIIKIWTVKPRISDQIEQFWRIFSLPPVKENFIKHNSDTYWTNSATAQKSCETFLVLFVRFYFLRLTFTAGAVSRQAISPRTGDRVAVTDVRAHRVDAGLVPLAVAGIGLALVGILSETKTPSAGELSRHQETWTWEAN